MLCLNTGPRREVEAFYKSYFQLVGEVITLGQLKGKFEDFTA